MKHWRPNQAEIWAGAFILFCLLMRLAIYVGYGE